MEAFWRSRGGPPEMRFTLTRLCGGKAIIVSPDANLDLDLANVAKILSGIGSLGKCDDAMVTMAWDGMDVTIYSQGKIMFFPLEDRDEALERAKTLLSTIGAV